MSSEVTAMFLSLPDELLVSILAYLCTSDRVRCSSINHRLKSIIDETILLQTQTECELANVTINPSRRAVPLANALQSLKEHQEAWRTLRWTNDMSVLMQVESEEHDIHVQGRDCGILGQVTADNRLVFTQIPSKVRGIEKRTWTLDNFTFPIADFTLDEREDLLVMVENVLTDPVGIVEVKLHMLLLTNGTAHPLGSAPISLNVPPFYGTSRLGFPVFKLAIAGECLGVMMGLLRDGQHNDIISHFWLCDWRTGELKQSLWCGCDEKVSNAVTFTFLSPDYILLPRFKWPDQQHELTVIRTRDPPRTGSYATLTSIEAVFDLPELQPDASHLGFNSIFAATPSPSPVFESVPGGGNDCTFTYSTESRILMFVATWVGSKTDEHLNFRLHVPIASFLDCLPPIPIVGSNATPIRNTDEGAPSVVHVPWKEWGKNVLFVRLTLTEYQDRFWNQCSHTCSLTMEHIDRPHQTVPSTSPNGNSLVEALVKYDFPSVMQMRRERRLSPSTLVPTESMLSEEEKELSLIRIEYHLDKEAVEVKGDDLWASPVFSAPHRRTVMKIDTPVGTHRDIIYYLSEDAVIFRHGLDVGGAWRVFSI